MDLVNSSVTEASQHVTQLRADLSALATISQLQASALQLRQNETLTAISKLNDTIFFEEGQAQFFLQASKI